MTGQDNMICRLLSIEFRTQARLPLSFGSIVQASVCLLFLFRRFPAYAWDPVFAKYINARLESAALLSTNFPRRSSS